MSSDKVRIQLDFTPKATEQLDVLRERLDAASRAEVVRRALALLDLATSKVAGGGEVVFRDADGSERVVAVV